MSDAPQNIVVQQESKLGSGLKIAAGAGGVLTVLLILKKLKDSRDLVQVQFNRSNIPHFTKKQLLEFIDVCCNGNAPKSGRPAACETYDNKRVACAWAPKAVQWMNDNNKSILYTWNPALLAKRLYEEMKGVTISDTAFKVITAALFLPMMFASTSESSSYSTREGLFQEIARLKVDQLRWLHNWWVVHHADGDNLYQWIGGEWGVDSSIRNAATANMDRAGVGSRVIINRSKIG